MVYISVASIYFIEIHVQLLFLSVKYVFPHWYLIDFRILQLKCFFANNAHVFSVLERNVFFSLQWQLCKCTTDVMLNNMLQVRRWWF